jgi:hypothetical protein
MVLMDFLRRLFCLSPGSDFYDCEYSWVSTQGQAWRHCTILHLFRKQGLAPSLRTAWCQLHLLQRRAPRKTIRIAERLLHLEVI